MHQKMNGIIRLTSAETHTHVTIREQAVAFFEQGYKNEVRHGTVINFIGGSSLWVLESVDVLTDRLCHDEAQD
jgi:hypothetical protein